MIRCEPRIMKTFDFCLLPFAFCLAFLYLATNSFDFPLGMLSDFQSDD